MNWSDVLKKIKEKIPKDSFDTWFANVDVEFVDGVIILKTNNEFAAEWIKSRYKTMILETVQEVFGQTYEIECYSTNETHNLYDDTQDTQIEISQYPYLLEKINELENRLETLELKNKMKEDNLEYEPDKLTNTDSHKEQIKSLVEENETLSKMISYFSVELNKIIRSENISKEQLKELSKCLEHLQINVLKRIQEINSQL